MSLKIYYIDDEPELCENFHDCFIGDNIEIKTFTDPNAGLKEIKLNPPDLLFVDYRMPNTTGDAVAQAVDPNIPKFLVTGDDSIVTKYKFTKVFAKPYSIEEVSELISQYLTAKKAA